MSINFQSRKTTYILAGVSIALFMIVAIVAYIFLIADPGSKYKVIDLREKSITEVETWIEENKIPEELSKISDLVCHCEFKYHREYDFGSYKRAYLYAKKNNILKNYNTE